MPYIMSDEEKQFLEHYDISRYKQPSVTVDIAVFGVMTDEEAGQEQDYRKDSPLALSLLLIRRGGYPYKGCWALPGGFARSGESLPECAYRELQEETSVTEAYLRSFETFSETGRDPRGWIISNGFLALVNADDYQVRGGSDAWDARWFRIGVSSRQKQKKVDGDQAHILTEYHLKLENRELEVALTSHIEEECDFSGHHETVSLQICNSEGFAFDHAGIILRAFQELRRKVEMDDRVIFDLMPDKFTLFHLQQVQEMILGKKLITPNFRRKIAPYVLETQEQVTGAGHRPAKLYRRNLEAFYTH